MTPRSAIPATRASVRECRLSWPVLAPRWAGRLPLFLCFWDLRRHFRSFSIHAHRHGQDIHHSAGERLQANYAGFRKSESAVAERK